MKLPISFAVVLLCAFAAAAQVKTAATPTYPPIWETGQVFVVTTANASAVQGMGRMYERPSWKSDWKLVGDAFPVVVGRNGLEWSAGYRLPKAPPARKREGDGKSPAGIFPLTFAFGSEAKPAGAALPYTQLGEFTECVDDIGSVHYNKVVDRMKVGGVDWKSSEKMLAVGPEYGLGVFVAYNTYPVVRGNGSCIFLHVWKNSQSGTAGCTAMERTDLESLVDWLEPAKNPYFVQMTEADYQTQIKTWKLPKIK